MPSKKPKIQGIIEPHLYERFTEWRKTIDAPNDGVGLNRLFALFFNEPIEEIPSNIADISILNDRVNQLIAEMNEMKKVKEACAQRAYGIDLLYARLAEVESQLIREPETFKEDFNISQDIKDIPLDNVDIHGDTQIEAPKRDTSGAAKSNESDSVIGEGETPEIPLKESSSAEDKASFINLGIPRDNQGISVESAENASNQKIDIQEDTKDISLSLSGVQLAKRLGCSEAAIRSHRNKGDLGLWTSERDPKGRAWKYENNRYSRVP